MLAQKYCLHGETSAVVHHVSMQCGRFEIMELKQ